MVTTRITANNIIFHVHYEIKSKLTRGCFELPSLTPQQSFGLCLWWDGGESKIMSLKSNLDWKMTVKIQMRASPPCNLMRFEFDSPRWLWKKVYNVTKQEHVLWISGLNLKTSDAAVDDCASTIKTLQAASNKTATTYAYQEAALKFHTTLQLLKSLFCLQYAIQWMVRLAAGYQLLLQQSICSMNQSTKNQACWGSELPAVSAYHHNQNANKHQISLQYSQI